MSPELFFEFAQEQWILFLGLLLIIFMIIQTQFADKLAGYMSVTPDQAVRLMNDGAFVLDVRSIDEFRTGHLNGAKNISIADLALKIATLSDRKEGPTLVYCESGARSARACSMLTKAGFTQLHNLSGGILSWRAANLPLAKQGKHK
jgi:rhodanese-related sulfurtransferase